MVRNVLDEWIASGEGERIEFKRGVPPIKDLAEDVVCLANARGGRILLGVGDRGEIVGCRDYDAFALKNGIFRATNPPITVEIEEVPTERGAVLVVLVPDSPVLHCTTSGKYLRRVGRSCEPIPPHQITAVLVEKGQLDYTSMPVPGAELADLDETALRTLRGLAAAREPNSELARLPEHDFLLALELVRRQGGKLIPTVAGLLLAGRQEALRELVPGAGIVYLRFAGEALEYEYREEIFRPAPQAVERVSELIEARNAVHTLSIGLIRLDIPDFPREAYREALLNAVCHRDYTQPDWVYVYHWPDRLKVASPGGFLRGITPRNILHHRPRHRNPALARAFQRLGYVEQAGIGVDRMFRVLLAYGKEPPEFAEEATSVEVTIRDGTFDRAFTAFVAEEERAGRPLSLDQLLVLAHVRRNRWIDRGTAAAVCQRSEREAGEVLADMVRRGLLERRGVRGGAEYHLPPRLYRLAGEQAAYVRERGLDAARAREMILAYARTWGEITNEKCRTLCGLTFAQASRLLADLTREGLLRREGRGRYTRYRPA